MSDSAGDANLPTDSNPPRRHDEPGRPNGEPGSSPASPAADSNDADLARRFAVRELRDRVTDPERPVNYRDARLDRELRRRLKLQRRERRRRRLRRHGRRAYIRSAYSLPSLATLGNAICGFGAMYVATLTESGADAWTRFFEHHNFVAAAYLIFVAMLFDALDGRLARLTRHTTDFGGQLDSLADVISFGAAPAFLALQVFKDYDQHQYHWDLSPVLSRLIWAIGALYVSCAAIRLARFNVSNQHGEQHHFSFLGLPSPGAAGAVAAFVLMQKDLSAEASRWHGHPNVAATLGILAAVAVWLLPVVVAGTGLLMVSTIRYPHLVNRYLRGRRSLQQLVLMVVLLLALVVAHRYTLGVCMLAYVLWGLIGSSWLRLRPRPAVAPAA